MNLPPESQPDVPAEDPAAAPESDAAKPVRRRRAAAKPAAAEGEPASEAAADAGAEAPKPRRRRKAAEEGVPQSA